MIWQLIFRNNLLELMQLKSLLKENLNKKDLNGKKKKQVFTKSALICRKVLLWVSNSKIIKKRNWKHRNTSSHMKKNNLGWRCCKWQIKCKRRKWDLTKPASQLRSNISKLIMHIRNLWANLKEKRHFLKAKSNF